MQSLLAEQAAEWLVRLEDSGGTAEERAELASWLRASPAHVMEFLKARAVWEAMGGTALQQWPDEAALLRGLDSGPASEIVTLPATRSEHRPLRWGRALVASIALLIAAGTLFWAVRLFDPSHALYETTVGQQSTHELPDGSTIALNTRSRVRLDFSSRYRNVRLEEGEVLFDVAQDSSRPFRVWTGNVMIRAIGTRFNVYRQGSAVMVTVLQGRVEAASNRNSVQLVAGERARVQASAPIRTEHLEHPERALDWQSRRLVFEQTPLADVIAEFNRYSETPLRLEDSTLAAKRVNGVFDASDRASLVRFLEEFEEVQVESRDGAVWVRRRN